MGNLFYDEQPKVKLSDLRIGDYVQMRPEYGPVDEDGDWMSNDMLDDWGCDDQVLFGDDYDRPSVGVVIGKVDGGVRARFYYGAGSVDEQDVPIESIVKAKEPTTRVKNALDKTA